MSRAKTERQLNLVIALIATRRPLTREQIKTAVPQYGQCPTDEAYGRMFERDKEELRELGIPLVTSSIDPLFDDEPGYRIDREAYAQPEIRLTSDETAVLALAARVWTQASLAGPASRGLLKLRASSADPRDDRTWAVEPRLRTPDPAFVLAWQAVRDRRPIRFAYRKAGSEHESPRYVDPWGIVSSHGNWYLVGHDHDRGAPRVFRLSRIVGQVRADGGPGTVTSGPDGDLRSLVDAAAHIDLDSSVTARVRIRPGSALPLRRRATQDTAAGEVIEIPYTDEARLARDLAGYGTAVLVEEPMSLRTAVLALLMTAAAEHARAGSG